MTRFQLVFRNANGDGEWSEVHENNVHDEPHINGELLVDGQTYVIKGVEWIGDSMRRFMCTLVVDPTDAVIDLH